MTGGYRFVIDICQYQCYTMDRGGDPHAETSPMQKDRDDARVPQLFAG